MPNPPAITQRQVDADHPWLGLESFTEATRKFFFGRDAEIADIFIRTRENPLTVLYGRSGLGKTSLLGAGLIPKLKLEGYRPSLIRLRYEKTDAPLLDQVRVALGALLQRDTPTAGDESAQSSVLSSASVPSSQSTEHCALSTSSAPSLWESLHHTATRDPSLPTAPPVLIFDQFEELFTLGQRAERIDEVRALFTELADVIENRPPAALKDRFTADRRLVRDYDLAPTPLRVVITLREDYLSHLEAWKRTLPSLMRNRMALHLLNGPQALDAVFKPGQMEGHRLVDEDTAARIVRFVAGRGPDVLLDEIDAVPPLLSLVCDELNAQRLERGESDICTEKTMIGGRLVPGADPEEVLEARSRAILQRFYQRSFTGFPKGVQHFVEDRMVTTAGHRCPVSRDDALAALTKARVKDPAEVLTTLVTRRLISSEERGGVQWFEITHDVLVPIVKESKDKRLARQRIRRMIAASVGLLGLLGVFGGVTAWALQTVAKLRDADAIQESLLLSASYTDHEAGLRAFSEHREAEGIACFERSLRFAPKNTSALAAGAQHSLGMNSPRWKTRFVLARGRTMNCMAFSPDGCYLVAGSGSFNRGEARVIEVATGKKISSVEFGAGVDSVSFSPDGRYVAAGSGSFDRGEARVIEAATGKEISKAYLVRSESSVNFSAEGSHLGVGNDNKSTPVSRGGQMTIKPAVRKSKMVTSVTFSPDGLYLAAGSTDKTARVIEAATGNEISKAEFGETVNSVSFSPDGRYIAASSDDKTARVIEAATGNEISQAMFGDRVSSVRYSPDGRSVAVGSYDKTLRVIEAATGNEISKAEFAETVNSVSFSPDGRYVAGGSDDNTARVIEAVTGREISQIEFGERVNSVNFSPDGRYLAACSTIDSRGVARVSEAATGKEISKTEFGEAVTSTSFSSDGRLLAVGGSDNTSRVIIEATTGKEITMAKFGGRVASVSFSPDGRYFAAGSEDGTARVIEVATGKEISRTEFRETVTCVSFSPDSRYLAAGSSDNTSRVIEAWTGKEISRTEFHYAVRSVRFSPDGRNLAVDGWIIEAETGKKIGGVESVDWVKDRLSLVGRYRAESGWGRTVRVVEEQTDREICQAVFGDRVNSMCFSPDGRLLAAGSDDKTVRLIEAGWLDADTIIAIPFVKALQLASGLKFHGDGRLSPLLGPDLVKAQSAITAFIEAPPPPDAKWQHAILTWAAMTPETRTTSPWTTEPLRVAAGRWFMQASGKVASFITDTADEVPWHPLEPVSLSRLEPRPGDKSYNAEQGTVRPTFLARLTLKRLRDADEQLYGRDTLAKYAAWSAKIMHEELKLDPEATEALAFALERTPPEKQKELLELKAKLAREG